MDEPARPRGLLETVRAEVRYGIEFLRIRWRRLLLAFAGVLLPLWAFGELADEVREAQAFPFDAPILGFAREMARDGFDRFFVVASRLGYAWGVVPFDLLLVLALGAMRKLREGLFAGVALLLAFGRQGLLGSTLSAMGIGLPFSRAAVILAQFFVAMPFYLQAAIAAFRHVDADHVLVARTLGASPARVFFTIAVPIAWPGLAGGAALGWARALGEFGATLMFAGNLTGRTQTLPLAIYTALEVDLAAAQSLSIVMLAVAFSLLVGIRAGARTP